VLKRGGFLKPGQRGLARRDPPDTKRQEGKSEGARMPRAKPEVDARRGSGQTSKDDRRKNTPGNADRQPDARPELLE